MSPIVLEPSSLNIHMARVQQFASTEHANGESRTSMYIYTQRLDCLTRGQMMLTTSISHQPSSLQIILAAQIVASQTVLYGDVILKATPSATLVVSSPLPHSQTHISPLLSCYLVESPGTRVFQTRQANLLSTVHISRDYDDDACQSPGMLPIPVLQCYIHARLSKPLHWFNLK